MRPPRRARLARQTSERAAILVSELAKRYGEIEAVRGIGFDVAPGETFGFIGPNGAGKSTTAKILCTLAEPTSGSARVAGRSPAMISPAADQTAIAELAERFGITAAVHEGMVTFPVASGEAAT